MKSTFPNVTKIEVEVQLSWLNLCDGAVEKMKEAIDRNDESLFVEKLGPECESHVEAMFRDMLGEEYFQKLTFDYDNGTWYGWGNTTEIYNAAIAAHLET